MAGTLSVSADESSAGVKVSHTWVLLFFLKVCEFLMTEISGPLGLITRKHRQQYLEELFQ